ncbi:MAG: GNAT family N-acetyltransferase [Deltaproteobacteria bacterium]|nr:GNAT family N-acetyltransferase [Deltaproteobacteria bacterium]
MQQLDSSEFQQQAQTYNRAVAAFAGIDPYCSRTDWILSFHASFTPLAPLHIWHEQESFVVLAQGRPSAEKTLFSSMDSMWGFATALVGGQSPRMLGSICRESLRQVHLILYGLPNDRGFLDAVARETATTHQAFLLNPVSRCVASLQGGMDGFLSRRSSKFRVNMRRAAKLVADAGVKFRCIDRLPADTLTGFYTELLAIESRSWKGHSGEGADQPPMRDFYRHMFKRIGPAGLLRVIVAELDGQQIGYLHGACVHGRFRGLQFSFDDRYRALSLGNVLQLNMLEWLCREQAELYDLGMAVPYKKKWAELEHRTQTMYLRPW